MISKKPEKIQFTAEGYDKLKRRFDELTRLRPEVVQRLQAAREMGDLSENGAYKAARWELGGIDRELRKLTYLLHVGEVVESKSSHIIGFGSVATINAGGKEMKFTLVSGYESNPAEQKLSVYSPIGKAIIGKKVGDAATAQTPGGEIEIKILKVE